MILAVTVVLVSFNVITAITAVTITILILISVIATVTSITTIVTITALSLIWSSLVVVAYLLLPLAVVFLVLLGLVYS